MKTYKEKFIPIQFPRDEQKHDHIIEWWYFNGNLTTEKGENFFFMNCLFAAKTKKVKIPFLATIPLKNIFFSHYLLAGNDESKQRVNPLCLVDKNNFTKPLLWINYDNECLIEETEPFNYRIVNDFIDLKLKSKKIPLLVDKNGFIDLSMKTSYYYSLTRLETTGIIKTKSKWVKVKGLSWMDHQWAQTPLTSDDEWTWFSLQLDSGMDILCFSYGNKIKTYHASIIDSKGKTSSTNNVLIKPIDIKYISRITKQTYQLRYEIEIPEYRIKLEISPVKTNQEMVFGTINYWEGGVNIKGTINNKIAFGKGFMELLPSTKNKQILGAIIQELKKNSLTENIKEMANISSKAIYSLSEELKKKKS